RLNLPTTLCRSFSTTNAIENMNGTLRRVIRNVKRWQGEAMIKRWVALGVAEAQRGFRRVKGHAQMKSLLIALRPDKGVVGERKAAQGPHPAAAATRSSTAGGASPIFGAAITEATIATSHAYPEHSDAQAWFGYGTGLAAAIGCAAIPF